MSFLLLALGVEPRAVALLVAVAVLLSGAIMLSVALWVSVTFERSAEVLTREEARRVAESIEQRRLWLTLLVGLLGIGVLGGAVAAVLFERAVTAKLLALAALVTLIYSTRRLVHRRPYLGPRSSF